METIFAEVERALKAGLYYMAIANCLAIPDICAALESQDGKASPSRYRAWFDIWLAPLYPELTGDDLYCLRCGVVHQGTFGHPGMQYDRVIFTVGGRIRVHRNRMKFGPGKSVLSLDAEHFCRDVVAQASNWFARKQNDQIVAANMPKLFQFRPQGLAPYIVGAPLIA
jgi:hypothetical protein